MRCPHSRSRNGCSRTSASSSATSSPWQPAARSAARRASRAVRYSSRSRTASAARPVRGPAPGNGSPLHNATAARRCSRACDSAPLARASSAARTRLRNRATSTSSGATHRLYPDAVVEMTSGPSARRMLDTYVCRVLRALAGGESPQSASMRASGPTTTPGRSASVASSVRSLAARRTISPGSPSTVRGPSRLIRTSATLRRRLTGVRPPLDRGPAGRWSARWRSATVAGQRRRASCRAMSCSEHSPKGW